MKPTYSEDYYRKQMDRMMRKYGEDADLERQLKIFVDGVDLPEQAIEVVKKMYAQKVADACKADLIKKMNIIKDIRNGRAALGYTSERQEVEARHDLIEGFEFTCLCLADFQKKYGLRA